MPTYENTNFKYSLQYFGLLPSLIQLSKKFSIYELQHLSCNQMPMSLKLEMTASYLKVCEFVRVDQRKGLTNWGAGFDHRGVDFKRLDY